MTKKQKIVAAQKRATKSRIRFYKIVNKTKQLTKFDKDSIKIAGRLYALDKCSAIIEEFTI